MKLVVLGDVLLDRDIGGSSVRCVPDTQAPVVDVEGALSRPGGAGLVARLARAAGHEATLITAMSDDGAAHELRRGLADVELVAGRSNMPTPVKTRVLRDDEVVVRVDEACTSPVPVTVTADMMFALNRADAIVVSDYGRGLLSDPALRRALARCCRRIPVVWDPHPRGEQPVRGVRVVTPNEAEACTFGGGDGVAAARHLRSLWGAEAVVVTLGDRGAWIEQGGGSGAMLRTLPLPKVDACGAGDRFACALAAELTRTHDLADAVRVAMEDTRGFLAQGGVAGLRPPAGSRSRSGRTGGPDPVDLARDVRAAGGTLVATGGCFDLLHAGHLRTLRAAREHGDALIALVNSDASVRRLKGPGRPLQPEAERLELLLALDCVDAVMSFDEDTPTALLELLRPDVWVKGGDYLPEMLPEAHSMQAWGGRIVTVPYHPGHSTTTLAHQLHRLPTSGA